MAVFLISFLLIATVVLIMSVGVIMGRKPVQGSCGGLNNLSGMDECELCGGSVSKCEELSVKA
ncbi:MAG: hypothetical protein ACJAY7_001007 [Pseudohongiellaceae bacterium]|jgi:hypothetical protein